MNQPQRLAALRIHLATIHRSGLAQRILERFGGVEDVFRRSSDELLAVPGVNPRVAERIRGGRGEGLAREEIERCEREGVEILVLGEAAYPAALADLPDMPLCLFCRGKLEERDDVSVGIVGSRRPSPYGLRQARRFARALAMRGVTVVSGLARGIDAVAQRAAIDAGGRTVAVLGSGLGNVYPPENRLLVEDITRGERGAVISEFPFGAPPRSFHFPQRNRLLSGLSRVIWLVEAGERSGSLITVDWALRQGKTVFALPGRVDQPQALGALRLLRDGAAPALEPGDLLEELDRYSDFAGKAAACSLSGDPSGAARPLPGPLGARLTALFEEEDVWHPDTLAARLGISPGELLAELARLEVEGLIDRTPDGGYTRGGGSEYPGAGPASNFFPPG